MPTTLARCFALPLALVGLFATVDAAAAAKRDGAPLGFKSRYVPGKKALPRGPLVKLGFAASRSDHMTAEQYGDLSLAVRAILKRYPADKNYFIGTGRDPAPLIAALELLGGRKMAMSFPASNIVYNNAGTITPELIGQYFKRLIPNAKLREEILKGDRKLVLLDQTHSGKTPNSLEPFIQQYLDQIGSKAKIVKLAVAPPGSSVQPGVARISTQRFPDVGGYMYAPYEGVVSEFPRHVLGNDPITALKPRGAYVRFKAAMLERMKRDKALHRFLRDEGGPAFAGI